MSKPNFAKSTAQATALLYNQNISDRILNIKNLDFGDKTIIFDTIQNYANTVHRPLSDFLSEDNPILKDGCTLALGNDTYLVLYNEETTYWEHLNWTLAHEIGHIYLGHTEDGRIEEIEAHYFAAQLFMPEYSVHKMSEEHANITEDDLIEIFGVSPEAAQKRLQTMKRRTNFSRTKLDKEIWEVQKKRVKLYYECNGDRYAYRNILDYTLYVESEYEKELLAEIYASSC